MIKVFFDTNLFIYLIEGSERQQSRAIELVEAANDRGYLIMTSTVTLGEVLVRPLEEGDFGLAAKYEEILQPPAIFVIDFGREAARRFAEVRKDRTIRGPDAMQLGCAASVNCDLFITNDERLSKKIIAGVHFITSFERASL